MWGARVSIEYSTGVQGIATRAAKLAATTNGLTSIEEVKAINTELGLLKHEIQKVLKRGSDDLAADKAARDAVRKAAAKYAREEKRAARERDAAVSKARVAASRQMVADQQVAA